MNQSQAMMESLDEKVSSFERVLRTEILRVLGIKVANSPVATRANKGTDPDISDNDLFKKIKRMGQRSDIPDHTFIRGFGAVLDRPTFNKVLKRARAQQKKSARIPKLSIKGLF